MYTIRYIDYWSNRRIVEQVMNVTEVSGTVFDADNSFAVAHCVSVDCAMGVTYSGKLIPCIALTLRELYPDIPEFCLSKNPKLGDAILYESDIKIFNLFTKFEYFRKPSYQTLEDSLHSMKEIALDKGITKIAMPRIGTGLDLLYWPNVKFSIMRVFGESDIEIKIFKYKKENSVW
jgi:hypothetical protein